MSAPSSSETSSAIEALRASQQHHVSMTAMADQKASLLLAAALLALALILPGGLSSLAGAALALTAAGGAIFCILAMMPRMLVLRDAQSNKELNLLFCGHFSSLAEDEYVDRVKEALATPEGALDALSRDLFQMGLLVHQKKFRFLGYAYTWCLAGLLITVVCAVLDRVH